MAPQASTTYTLVATGPGGTATRKVILTVVQAPVLSQFTATPASIYQGDPSTLAWSVTGATSLSLDNGLGTVTGTSLAVRPSATLTYTLTATNTLNGVNVARSRTVTVTVAPRPTVPSISAFTADAAAVGIGNGTTLRWTVANAVGAVNVSISGVGLVSATGTRAVAPDITTSYTLTATNALDSTKSVTATVTVAVVPRPTLSVSVGSPGGAASGTLCKGQSATLYWSALNPTTAPLTLTVRVNGGSSLPATGSTTVSPTVATTYTLTATNNYGGTVTAQATIAVTVAPVILGFSASATTLTVGSTVTLSWSAQGGQTRTINGVPLQGDAGTMVVAPSRTKDYTLKVSYAAGSQTRTLTVTVQGSGLPVWVRDIVYIGTQEVAEFDKAGIHVTHVDHLGSPRMVTNAQGVKESVQKYLPFGETLDQEGNFGTAKGYTNHEQTDASGLIYMQARFYAPQFHRFMSPDPSRDQHFEQTQSWNIYSYVQNAPIMKVDPTGLRWIHPNSQSDEPGFTLNFESGKNQRGGVDSRDLKWIFEMDLVRLD